MGLLINGVEVTRIELGGVEVEKIEDSQGNVLYSSTPAPSKTLTLTYNGYDFSWTTSDGRSGSMASGDPDYTLAISSGQTVTFVTAGNRDRLSIDGVDQCGGDDPHYTYDYAELAGGEVITCEHFTEAC